MLYPVAIQQRNNIYHAHFPDVPEIKVEHSDMAETITASRQAIMKHISTLLDSEKNIPQASDLNTHLANPKYAGWTWAIVSLDIERIVGEKIDIKINIPQRLYKRVQQHLKEQELDLNNFVIEAIKKALN